MKNIAICFVFLFGLVVFGQACQFKDSKGNTYDLTALKKNDDDYFIPRNTFPNQIWDIWINICRAVVTQKCGADCACCQEWDSRSPSGHASLGKFSTGTWMDPKKPSKDGYGLSIEFVNGDNNRKMELDLTCDPNAGAGKPVYLGESPQLHYNFQFASASACPIEAPKKGISASEIILILLIVGVVVYFVAGILIKKFKMGASGIDMIPNVGFWTSLPGLVKDGFMFIINTIRGRGSYSQV
jgi:hypothetical protein